MDDGEEDEEDKDDGDETLETTLQPPAGARGFVWQIFFRGTASQPQPSAPSSGPAISR